MNPILKVFIYVSCWVLAWVIFGSIINTGFIVSKIYSEGSKAQLIMFLASSVVFIFGAFSLSSEVFNNQTPIKEEKFK